MQKILKLDLPDTKHLQPQQKTSSKALTALITVVIDKTRLKNALFYLLKKLGYALPKNNCHCYDQTKM